MTIFFIVVALVFSALFSGSEIAYVSSNKLRVELKKKRNTYRSRILAGWFDRPANFISTMLVGNNAALVAFSTLMTDVLNVSMIPGLGLENGLLITLVNTVVITLIVLVFGEFIPKTLFRLFSDDALYFLAVPLRWLQLALYVPSMIMTGISSRLMGLFFKQPAEALDNVLTRSDLETFVNEGSSTGEESIDVELFGKALNLHDVRIRDCMIPRKEIQSIDVNAPISELVEKFQETRLSRLLVYDGDIDNLLGYVHHQSLLEYPKQINDCIMEITYVPEVTKVTDMLNATVTKSVSIACVVDEFGGVSGIVTMEDLLEQIFGEIEDEYDDDDYINVKESEDSYRFSGRLEINYLKDEYNLRFPDGDYQTLSGYLVTVAERVPEEGEVLEIEGYRFELLEVSNTRIEVLRLVVVE
ncbi:hypothetical protein CEQ90_14865 [Lewinellaceae bacterium SD302]|nr:hypothetical protein CEQ90_14865 [Lewinellaceae bacterium SD302]